MEILIKENIVFRESKESEVNEIIDLIKEFSVYVQGKDVTNIDIEAMKKAFFQGDRVKHSFIEVNGKIAGYMVYFYIYSTFKGREGIYLEDLYVKEQYRGLGIGTKAFEYLKKIAKENNYCRIEWNCLKSNLPAMSFYREKLKAGDMDELTFFTLEESDF